MMQTRHIIVVLGLRIGCEPPGAVRVDPTLPGRSPHPAPIEVPLQTRAYEFPPAMVESWPRAPGPTMTLRLTTTVPLLATLSWASGCQAPVDGKRSADSGTVDATCAFDWPPPIVADHSGAPSDDTLHEVQLAVDLWDKAGPAERPCVAAVELHNSDADSAHLDLDTRVVHVFGAVSTRVTSGVLFQAWLTNHHTSAAAGARSLVEAHPLPALTRLTDADLLQWMYASSLSLPSAAGLHRIRTCGDLTLSAEVEWTQAHLWQRWPDLAESTVDGLFALPDPIELSGLTEDHPGMYPELVGLTVSADHLWLQVRHWSADPEAASSAVDLHAELAVHALDPTTGATSIEHTAQSPTATRWDTVFPAVYVPLSDRRALLQHTDFGFTFDRWSMVAADTSTLPVSTPSDSDWGAPTTMVEVEDAVFVIRRDIGGLEEDPSFTGDGAFNVARMLRPTVAGDALPTTFFPRSSTIAGVPHGLALHLATRGSDGSVQLHFVPDDHPSTLSGWALRSPLADPSAEVLTPDPTHVSSVLLPPTLRHWSGQVAFVEADGHGWWTDGRYLFHKSSADTPWKLADLTCTDPDAVNFQRAHFFESDGRTYLLAQTTTHTSPSRSVWLWDLSAVE